MLSAIDGRSLLERWLKRAREGLFQHYAASERYNSLNLWLGVPVIVLTTLVGTAVFASLQKQVEPKIQIGVGLISVAAAVLSGLQTFLQFSERAERHRVTGARYSAIRREIELMLAVSNASDPIDAGKLEALLKKIDELGNEAPSISAHIWRLAEKKIAEADKDAAPRAAVSVGSTS
jgi:hypothetical protein